MHVGRCHNVVHMHASNPLQLAPSKPLCLSNQPPKPASFWAPEAELLRVALRILPRSWGKVVCWLCLSCPSQPSSTLQQVKTGQCNLADVCIEDLEAHVGSRESG